MQVSATPTELGTCLCASDSSVTLIHRCADGREASMSIVVGIDQLGRSPNMPVDSSTSERPNRVTEVYLLIYGSSHIGVHIGTDDSSSTGSVGESVAREGIAGEVGMSTPRVRATMVNRKGHVPINDAGAFALSCCGDRIGNASDEDVEETVALFNPVIERSEVRETAHLL